MFQYLIATSYPSNHAHFCSTTTNAASTAALNDATFVCLDLLITLLTTLHTQKYKGFKSGLLGGQSSLNRNVLVQRIVRQPNDFRLTSSNRYISTYAGDLGYPKNRMIFVACHLLRTLSIIAALRLYYALGFNIATVSKVCMFTGFRIDWRIFSTSPNQFGYQSRPLEVLQSSGKFKQNVIRIIATSCTYEEVYDYLCIIYIGCIFSSQLRLSNQQQSLNIQ